MSRLLCCLRARRPDMGAALSHPQEGEACDGAGLPAAPPTMADVIRERKKKAGGAALGTLRRRLASAARRPRDHRPDRGCEHARFIRSVVGGWRLAEVFLLCEELEAGAALRDLATQAELAREPAPALHIALAHVYTDRWWCDVEVVGAGWSLCAHRAVLAARSDYFRDLLQRYPPSCSRVPLEGACAALSREEADAALLALYSGGEAPRRHCTHHNKYESNEYTEGDLDVVDNTATCRGEGAAGCACAARRGAARRAAQLLGARRDPLATSMRYLLDSGEMADAKLVFRLEGGCGAAYGFRSALELPCHRVLLAARSRFFRSVMSRRGACGAGGAVCVDEKVLPRRFARALLHAAYTDQVDLSLIGRNTALPNTATSTSTGWAGGARGAGGRLTAAGLEDAFQLYEIGRFLEMPIVVQGCEDALAEALAHDTLPPVLRWAAQGHASQWLHRQAMRYLRDEFVSVVSGGGAAALPAPALAAALASPFLQASEPAALRALLKWAADHKHKQREPNVVWHTAHSVSRRGARRRELTDAALRDILAPLVQHIRTEHIPPDNELLQQLVRRGIVPAPPAPPAGEESSADAWLGRGAYRPARCFLPYLDEIKALLAEQAVPEAELARARRARYLHRIPDTLYMVAAGRVSPVSPGGAGAAGAARACVSARTAAALRARARELRAAPPARTAAARAHHLDQLNKQIALRAVREMSLPDACAELLLTDIDDNAAESGAASACETPRAERRVPPAGADRDDAWTPPAADCCRSGGSLRCASTGSLRHHDLNNDNCRTNSCSRRDQQRNENPHHSRSLSGSWSRGAAGPGGAAPPARLSACVPDVAMAPNANTHLLTARDYFRLTPWEYGGVVLQLDLGDGATHTPRPGSRAQRNSSAQHARPRDLTARPQGAACVRGRSEEEELRAAIELSVIRAYSSFHGRAGAAGARRSAPPSARDQPSAPPRPDLADDGAGAARGREPRARDPPAPLLAMSPRRRDHRLEAGHAAGSGASSRAHSPNYA